MPPQDDNRLRDAAILAQGKVPGQPRLPDWLVVRDLGEERLEFASPSLSYVLSHPALVKAFAAMSPLLDGHHGTREVVDAAVAADTQPATAIFLLKCLYANGVLFEGRVEGRENSAPDGALNEHLDYYAYYSPDPGAVLAALSQARVLLVASSPLVSVFDHALAQFGVPDLLASSIPVTRGGSFMRELEERIDAVSTRSDPLLVVALLENHQEHFSTVNELCLERSVRWLRCAAHGPAISLGPTFIPRQTACYACLQHRRLAHSHPFPTNLAEGSRQFHFSEAVGHASAYRPLWSLAAAQAALECVRLISGHVPPTTLGRYFELGSTTPAVDVHDVLRMPRCSVCRGATPREAGAYEL